jgi:hypothetical protein
MAAFSASPSSMARAGSSMVRKVVLEPAVDAIDGDPNTALRILSVAARIPRSCGVVRDIQDSEAERLVRGALSGLLARGFHRRQGRMDGLPAFRGRTGRGERGSGRIIRRVWPSLAGGLTVCPEPDPDSTSLHAAAARPAAEVPLRLASARCGGPALNRLLHPPRSARLNVCEVAPGYWMGGTGGWVCGERCEPRG